MPTVILFSARCSPPHRCSPRGGLSVDATPASHMACLTASVRSACTGQRSWRRTCCDTPTPANSPELAPCSGGAGSRHGSFAPMVQPSSGRRSRTFSRLSMISCTSSSAAIAAAPPVFSAMCSNSPSRRRIRAKRTVVTRSFAEPWCVCSARRRLSSSRCSVLITSHGSGRVLIESQADTSPRAIRADAPATCSWTSTTSTGGSGSSSATGTASSLPPSTPCSQPSISRSSRHRCARRGRTPSPMLRRHRPLRTLDRILIINQRHAAAVRREFARHDDDHRPHSTLGQAAPSRPLPPVHRPRSARSNDAKSPRVWRRRLPRSPDTGVPPCTGRRTDRPRRGRTAEFSVGEQRPTTSKGERR